VSQAGEKQGKKALVISEARIKTIDVGEAELGQQGELPPYDDLDIAPPPGERHGGGHRRR
jgi:hypothetical protein